MDERDGRREARVCACAGRAKGGGGGREERGKRRGKRKGSARPRSIVTSNESNGGRGIVDVSGIFIRRGRNGWKKPRSRFSPTTTTTTTRTHANLIKRIKAGSVHACYRMNRILLRPTEFGDRTD